MSFVPLQTTKGFLGWPGSEGFSSRRVYPWVQAGVRICLLPLLSPLPSASHQCHQEGWQRPSCCTSISLGWGAGLCQAHVAEGQ